MRRTDFYRRISTRDDFLHSSRRLRVAPAETLDVPWFYTTAATFYCSVTLFSNWRKSKLIDNWSTIQCTWISHQALESTIPTTGRLKRRIISDGILLT
jgi:hypothetical protein